MILLIEREYYEEVMKRVRNVYDKFVLWLLDREPCVGYGTLNGKYYMFLLEEEARNMIDRLVERGVLDRERIEVIDEGVADNELEEAELECEQCKTCKYFAALLGLEM